MQRIFTILQLNAIKSVTCSYVFTILYLRYLMKTLLKDHIMVLYILTLTRIKSKCCVKYANVGQASETRMALNGITWPMDNKTPLAVYFTSAEQMERFKNSPDEPVRIVTTNRAPGRGPREWDREKVERGERRRERSEEAVKQPTQPTKSLEELFNKTKTVPALYWKPLSDETIK